MASNGETNGFNDNNANMNRHTGAIPKTSKITRNIPLIRIPDNNNAQHSLTANGFKSNGICNGLVLKNGSNSEPSTSRTINDPDSDDCSSSDTANDLSCSDECCIYTYKGDTADLPNSFLNLDEPDPNDADVSRPGSRGSSPEMDYLEMDFDPGPSCDADSDVDSVSSDLKTDENIQQQEGREIEGEPENQSIILEQDQIVQETKTEEDYVEESNNIEESNGRIELNDVLSLSSTMDTLKITPEPKPLTNLEKEPWIPKTDSNRTLGISCYHDPKGHHSSSGDLMSPNDSVNVFSPMPTTSTSNAYEMEQFNASIDLERTMIWSEVEAGTNQVTQISTSACGATAVLNVLKALRFPLPTIEQLNQCMCTRLRAINSPLVTYLKSRSVAGVTHKDIIRALSKLTDGQIYARFFHMYPERYVNLTQWLGYWIEKGAVPIATLNLQKGLTPGTPIPDAWHHQMIYGVQPQYVYLTNPLEKINESVLWPQLSSESVLLVRREDILPRWTDKTNLRELMTIPDTRWHQLNVLGQVANVIREHHRLVCSHSVSRTHVSVPASYSSGITLAIQVGNPACELLKQCAELPTLNAKP